MYYEVTNKFNGLTKQILPSKYTADEIDKILQFYTHHPKFTIDWILQW